MAEPIPIRVPDSNVKLLTDGLENALSGQGLSLDSRSHGSRRFNYQRMTPQQLLAAYQDNAMAANIVEIPAFEMTRTGRTFTIEDENEREALKLADKNLGVFAKCREAQKWAELLGGGAILMGLDETGELHEPLKLDRVKPGSLKFLHALDATTLIPWLGEDSTVVVDPTSVHFMTPENYQVVGSKLKQIHHTRIVRFQGVQLPWREMQRNLWWGQSRLERTLDQVLDAESVVGGVASLIQEAKVDVFKFPNLMEIVKTPEGEELIAQRVRILQRFKSMFNGIIISADEEWEQKQNTLAQGMSPVIEQFLVLCAMASQIPVTRLVGTSAKGLTATGEGDQRNFYDYIEGRQESDLCPQLNQLDEVLFRATIGRAPESSDWELNPLWQMDEKEMSEVQNNRADRDQKYVDLGVITPLEVAKNLHEDRTYSAIDSTFLTDLEAIVKAAEEGETDPSGDDPPEGDPKKTDPKDPDDPVDD